MSTFVLEPDRSPGETLEGVKDLYTPEPSERGARRVTYLDTFDWRLWSRGALLTGIPEGRGVRLTLRQSDGSVWEDRNRGRPAFASDLPQTPFRKALEAVTGIRRLLPQAWARWENEQFDLKNEDAKTVVRALVRRGRAWAPGSKASELLPPLLEILPLKGYDAELKRVLARLRRDLGREVGETEELAAVLASLGKTPGTYSSSFRLVLDSQARAGEAARAIHSELLGTMRANLDGVIRDLDPEFLHDFRVAVRRARSALAQIRGVFPEEIVERHARELSWLGERTGPVRDLDVYLLKIPAYREALPTGAAHELDPLVEFLRGRKKDAHRRMVRSLRSQRFERLVRDWRSILESTGSAEAALPDASRRAGDLASECIARAHRKVLKRGRKTDRKTSPETLHRLRIDCKKLRYLMTFFQSLFPAEELGAMVKETKKLQDVLGDFNDLYVQRNALLSFAGEMMAKGIAPPATLMAMGRLMGGMEAQQALERERFHEAFRRFSRKKNQARFEKLFGAPPPTGPTASGTSTTQASVAGSSTAEPPTSDAPQQGDS